MQLLHTQPTVGSSPTITTKSFWPVSSGVEQRLDKAWVGGSRPPLATMFMWGISSFGRAAALQAVGDQFDPGILHQFLETETYRWSRVSLSSSKWIKWTAH